MNNLFISSGLRILTPRKITSLRFTHVVFGLTSSPFLLKGTIKIHLSIYLPAPHYTNMVKKLILISYVDDSTNSFDTIKTAMEFYEKSNKIFFERSKLRVVKMGYK